MSMKGWWLSLIVCLGVAYWASLPIAENSIGKISIINLDVNRIESIEFKGASVSVFAARRGDMRDRWWVSLDSSSAAPDATGAAGAPTKEKFMASRKMSDVLMMFSPFQAVRDIGKVDAARLTEFGLSANTKTLVVKDGAGAELLSVLVGKQLYGSRNTYVMTTADQRVWLISGDLISDIEKPELRVYERAITSIANEDIQAATVMMSGKSRTFSHSKRDAKGELIWSSESGTQGPSVAAASWFERLDRLKAAFYATPEVDERLKSVAPLFEVKISGSGLSADVIQIRRLSNGTQDEYWLTSDYLRWHVKVAATRAEVLVKDLPQIFAN